MWVGVTAKPRPTDWDATPNGFTRFVNSGLARENDGCFSVRSEVGEMCSMKCNVSIGVLIVDMQDGVSWSNFYNLNVWVFEVIHKGRVDEKSGGIKRKKAATICVVAA